MLTSSSLAGTSFADGGGGGASPSRVSIISHSGGACQVEGIVGGATGFPKLEPLTGGAVGHCTGSGGLLDLVEAPCFRIVPVLSDCFPETFTPWPSPSSCW